MSLAGQSGRHEPVLVKEDAMILSVLTFLFWVLVIFVVATYLIYRLNLDGMTLRLLEPVVHKLCGHSKKW